MPDKKTIGLVYHDDFNKYDLGLDHPLIGDKPKKTIKLLKEKKMLELLDIFKPKLAEESDILKAHNKEYIKKIKNLSKVGGFLAADTPAPKGIYDIASLATGGTLLCGKKLFEKHKIMINPLGGFHHAGISSSSGFCFINDIAVLVEKLRNEYNLERFLIIDLDLHHGNGTQEIYSNDPSVLNLSFHQDGNTLYPGTGAIDYIGKEKGLGYTINLPMPPGTGSKGYIYAFDEIVPKITKQFKPEIIIYQSGVDPHHEDPLGDLLLSYQTFYFLAKKMRELSKESCDKIAVLMGGGYNSDASVKSNYNVVCGLINHKYYIREFDNHSFKKYEIVKNQVSKLKKVLKPHWSL